MEEIYKAEIEKIDAMAQQFDGILRMFDKLYEAPENKD